MTGKRFSASLLYSVGAVALMAPALRLFPRTAARLAGRGAWLSALAALPVIALYALLLRRIMSRAAEGEGLAELIKKRGGAPMLYLCFAWLALYCAFSLRAGSERLTSTVYPDTPPFYFIIIMGLSVSLAAFSSARTVARAAKLIEPVLIAVTGVILVSALFGAELSRLAPVRSYSVKGVLAGAVAAADVISAPMYALCFLACAADKSGGRPRPLIYCAAACLFLSALSAAVTGSLGDRLAAELTHPFFSLVRSQRVLGALETVDALVVALWVFPDWLIGSVFLWSALRCLALAFGEEVGAWVSCAVCGAVIALALIIGRDAAGLALWSERIIPGCNLVFAFGLVPALAYRRERS